MDWGCDAGEGTHLTLLLYYVRIWKLKFKRRIKKLASCRGTDYMYKNTLDLDVYVAYEVHRAKSISRTSVAHYHCAIGAACRVKTCRVFSRSNMRAPTTDRTWDLDITSRV